MLEGIVATVVGAVLLWLAPLTWKRSAPRIRWARLAIRQRHRLWRFRRGRYVPRLTVGELELLVKDPGVAALHPRVREEIERFAQRRYAEQQREPWIPRRPGWLRRRHSPR